MDSLPWFWDNLGQFPVQFALVMAGCAGVGLWLGLPRASTLFALLAVLHALPPLAFYSAPQRAAAAGPRLRVLLANLWYRNHQHAAFANALQQLEPDLVALLELTPGWQRALRATLAPYPHRVEHLRQDAFGLGLYSRQPLHGGRLTRLPGTPSLEAQMQQGPVRLSLLLLHTPPPQHARWAAERDRMLAAVPGWVRRQDGPQLVLGDLNVTPFGGGFRRMLAASGLHDPRRGRGLLPTWPAGLPAALRIPLDHALPGPGLELARLRVLPDLGSDHRALYLELSLPQGQAPVP